MKLLLCLLTLLALTGCPLPCPSGTTTNGGEQCRRVSAFRLADLDGSVSIVNQTPDALDVQVQVARVPMRCDATSEIDEALMAESALGPSRNLFSVPDRFRLATVSTQISPGSRSALPPLDPVHAAGCVAMRIWAKGGAFETQLLVRSEDELQLQPGSEPGALSLVRRRAAVAVRARGREIHACPRQPPMFSADAALSSPMTVRAIENVWLGERSCDRVTAASRDGQGSWTSCVPNAWSFPLGTQMSVAIAAPRPATTYFGLDAFYAIFELLDRGAPARRMTFRHVQRVESIGVVSVVPSDEPCQLDGVGLVRHGGISLATGGFVARGSSFDVPLPEGKTQVFLYDAYRVYVSTVGKPIAEVLEVVTVQPPASH